MTFCNNNLSEKRWFELSFFDQMANMGCEVGRAINWKTKYPDKSKLAVESTLELLDLTIIDKKNHSAAKLKELCILREALVDYFMFDNIYGSSDEKWNNYFYAFNYAARLNH